MGLKNTSVFPTVLLLRWVKNTACEEVLAGVNLCRVGLHGLSVLSFILAIILASPIFHNTYCLHFQDLYQYVVSQDVVPPFSLYTPHPRQLLILSEESVISYNETLLIVASEDQSYDQTVIDVLSDKEVRFKLLQSVVVFSTFILLSG